MNPTKAFKEGKGPAKKPTKQKKNGSTNLFCRWFTWENSLATNDQKRFSSCFHRSNMLSTNQTDPNGIGWHQILRSTWDSPYFLSFHTCAHLSYFLAGGELHDGLRLLVSSQTDSHRMIRKTEASKTRLTVMQSHAVYEFVICLWPCLHNVVLVGTWCEHMPDADGHAHMYNNGSVPASWLPTGETDCDQATQSFHRFGTRAVDLWHHQLDILGLNALFIHFALLQSCTMCTPAAQERQHLHGTNQNQTHAKRQANCSQTACKPFC